MESIKKENVKTKQTHIHGNISGITLIALVVTIVILIILATISVNLIINGGLIGKASETKFKNRMTAHKESVELYMASEATKIEGRLTDRTTVHAGEVLKQAITDKVVENITVEDVTRNIKDVIPDIKKDEEKYLVVYEGELYYVSSPNIKNNTEQEQWCREMGIPILSYVPPTGIVIIDGGYELVKGLYLCTPNIEDGFIEEKTRYLEVGSNGCMQPGNWTTHYPKDTWYDYKNGQWANIYVESDGKEVYYVWIPRYCYKTVAGQRTDVKFINTDNTCKEYVEGKDEPKTISWAELEADGYIIPDAFTFDGKAIAGYWVSKYTVGELSNVNTIEFETSSIQGQITISNIQIKEEVTKNNPIVKYTIASNGKIFATYDKAADVADINNKKIPIKGLRPGNNTINVTGLNAKGEVVGSMTKEYELSEPNAPDLSGFNKDITFYVEYDASGEKIVKSDMPVSKTRENDWYDYENSKWANVVVRNEGQEIYYVWIPRYEYKVEENQRTTIKFIKTTQTTPSGGYTIPDAFTFDGKALAGYWVSKYTVGDATAPVFTAETAVTSNSITTKGVTGSGVADGLTYHYYLNGDKKKTTTNAEEHVPFTGLVAGTKYTITIYVTKGSEYVGAYAKQIITAEANAPDLSGFLESNTYYVVYDEAGENIVSQNQLIKKDGSNAPDGWYDYSKNKWANIMVKTNNATTYYTWIPRYEYRLSEGQVLQKAKGRTEINFIPSTKTTATDGYTIPDAFTFNGKALSGYWVSKYTVGEQTYTP